MRNEMHLRKKCPSQKFSPCSIFANLPSSFESRRRLWSFLVSDFLDAYESRIYRASLSERGYALPALR